MMLYPLVLVLVLALILLFLFYLLPSWTMPISSSERRAGKV